MGEGLEAYRRSIIERFNELLEIAREARAKGLDPELEPEPGLASDMAGLVEGMTGPPGVAERIRELSGRMEKDELAFKIAEEIAKGSLLQGSEEEKAEQALRTALAILTEGVTAAPVQGISGVRIKQNSDGTRYLAIYYAGPIRSAGGTDQAITVVLGDFIRRSLGFGRYKPTEAEARRFVEEIRLYEREVARFQYNVPDKEIIKAVMNLPVEINGVPTNPIEVSFFRDLPRVETNRLRGGALLVLNDGLIGRAKKVLKIVEKLGLDGWEWLKDIGAERGGSGEGILDEVIAGRPVLSTPNRPGGFRLRYGRSRNTGLAAVGIHPALMVLLHGFVAIGTQIKLEVPGKGGVAMPVDGIEPPIVMLKNGSVLRVETVEEAKAVVKDVKSILFLGDLLISYGDFLYSNKELLPSGYVEEWWAQEVEEAIKERFNGDLRCASKALGIGEALLSSLLKRPLEEKPDAAMAIRISRALQVPLHPRYTYFWHLLKPDEMVILRRWALSSDIERSRDGLVLSIRGDMDARVKSLLERLCVPHSIQEAELVIEGGDALVLATCLGVERDEEEIAAEEPGGDALRLVERLSGLKIRNKAPVFLGARMGRPEKAKEREMKPLVHVLFPIGLAGGPQRNVVEAAKKELVEVELANRACERCGARTPWPTCPRCGGRTRPIYTCPRCGRELAKGIRCPSCGLMAVPFKRTRISVGALLREASERLGLRSRPELVKGVKGLISEEKLPEPLEKGLLRAIHGLSVFRDGTIRFDATNAPLTHFKPAEIGTPVEVLRELGYDVDIEGRPLRSPEQICELKPQDVILPREAGAYLVRVAKFIDELLTSFYGLKAYYKAERPEDLIGHLVIGLAPHTSVGVVGRIIGFTNAKVCYAHPIWHSAKRRDCDGDEDSVSLVLDVLLNFSKAYLPARLGGMMDAPLFIMPVVRAQDVQRQAQEMDVAWAYPLEFYKATLQRARAREVEGLVKTLKDMLEASGDCEGAGFTMPTGDIVAGVLETAYKRLKTMRDKLSGQMGLADMIEAVDAREVAAKVLTTHFLRDIVGNLRAFATQALRCKKCNKRFRRPPLSGRCDACGGELALTVHRGTVEKYLRVAELLVRRYELPSYYAQRLKLIRDEIESLFGGRGPKQASLADFM